MSNVRERLVLAEEFFNRVRKENEESKNNNQEESVQEGPIYEEYLSPGEELKAECYNQSLYKKIRDHGFLIYKYEKNISTDDLFGDTVQDNTVWEKYYCRANNWSFVIKNMEDYDIKQGIWAIHQICNDVTGETLSLYLDFGCRNTSYARLVTFLNIIKYDTLEEYFNVVYGKYLKSADIAAKSFSGGNLLLVDRSIPDSRLVMKLREDLYLVLYMDDEGKFRFVATNCKNWGHSSCNKTTSYDRAYYIDTEDCINKVCPACENLIHHMDGEIGFVTEDGYFREDDIREYFRKIKDSFSCRENDNMVTMYFRSESDMGMEDYGLVSNLATGLEVYMVASVDLNNSFMRDTGDVALNLVFEYSYDKREDKDNMKLHVYGYSSDNLSKRFEFLNDEKKYAYYKAMDKAMEEGTGSIRDWDYAKLGIDDVYKGKPQELLDIAAMYIEKAAAIYNVFLKEGE